MTDNQEFFSILGGIGVAVGVVIFFMGGWIGLSVLALVVTLVLVLAA